MAALVASAVAATESLENEHADPVPAAEPPSSPKNFEIVVPPRTGDLNEFQKFAEEEEQEGEEGGGDDGEVIEPAYYSEGTAIPVFTPTMDQFRSFSKFVDKINHYGMTAGIIKVIPPKEWNDALPPLDEKVKDIRIKNPIEQHIAGSAGEFRQTNVEKQRTYNLPEWRSLCESSNHQPPARRGERRKGQTQPVAKRGARPRRSTAKEADVKLEEEDDAPLGKTNPPTPESPVDKVEDATPEPVFGRQPRNRARTQETPGLEADTPGGRQPRKARRKTAKERAEDRELADEVAYEGFDYRMSDVDSYTPERCAELEKAYWRTLTYNNPLYGADMPGSLFDDTTTSWNVAKLDNLLDCLGKKLPGVNTAYLYLGMWKSTFAWHLEDMDLYSINYIHFGAPKQWYSISRTDKEKFEGLMKGIWPNDSKKCSQFLRHKTFLVSPAMLAQHGIKVNKLVHKQGEFVITFPFGYHSGYNLGYNCAESVNFATSSWLKFGREAKKCECIDDAVFVDIDEIERKLLGLPTDDEDEDDEDEEEYGYYDEDGERAGRTGDFPTPPESIEGRPKRGRPRKRKATDSGDGTVKKARMKLPKPPTREPCVLCPNDIPSEPLLDTEHGGQAHRLCAIYTPETYFKWDYAAGKEIVANVHEIPRDRHELKCVFCRQKKGSCFQCSAKKCNRAYHATCAAAAGVLVNMVDVQVTGEDGEKYAQTNIDYRCKVHRPKRPKDWDSERLEDDLLIRKFSAALIKDDVIQMQYFGGDIFAGVVLENRRDEDMVLVQILPKGDIMEVEWKWILAQDPSQTYFPDAITTAPLYPDPSYPPARKAKVAQKDIPEPDQPFGDADSNFKWGELVVGDAVNPPNQAPTQGWWHYLGELSTEYIPKYSEDPARRVHNSASNFVIPKQPRQRSYKAPALPHHGHYPMSPSPRMGYYMMSQPGYPINSPPEYRPQLHNNQMAGYGPPPPRNPYQLPMSPPPPAPAPPISSSPHFGPHYAAAPPQDRAPALSLPLQQLFGEAPAPPRSYASSPQNFATSRPPPPQHVQQQQKNSYPPMMLPPTFPQPHQYHPHPMPMSSAYLFHSPTQQQRTQYPPPPPPPPHPSQLYVKLEPEAPSTDPFSAFMGGTEGVANSGSSSVAAADGNSNSWEQKNHTLSSPPPPPPPPPPPSSPPPKIADIGAALAKLAREKLLQQQKQQQQKVQEA